MIKRKNWKRLLCGLLLLYGLWLLICCVLLPLHHKAGPAEGTALSDVLPRDLGSQNERVWCVDDNVDALLWRLRVVETAQEELLFTTFDFREDESGKDMMAALLAAAERGVKIRMVIDGINAQLFLNGSDWFRTLAASPNVEVKFYNPVHLLMPWRFNYRMHDKYLIADGRAYLLGGRNTNDLFLGDYQENKNIDRDLLVYSPGPEPGDSLTALKDYFEGIWDLPVSRSFAKKPPEGEEVRQDMHGRYQLLHTRYPEAFSPVDWVRETVPTGGIRLLTNPVEAENKQPDLWTKLVRLMASGQEVTVQTPYIICGREMYQDITALEAGGTQIQTVINAVENGANPWGCTDYLNQKKKLRTTGMELFEYIGENSLHTKTVLVDEGISVVGSFNWDMRSAYLDTELMLVVDSPALNAHIREVAQKEMEQSLHVSPDGGQTPGAEYQARELSLPKTVFYFVLRMVLPLFRHLL